MIHYKPTRVGWLELVVSAGNATEGGIEQVRRGFVAGQTLKLSPDDFKYGVGTHFRWNAKFYPNFEALDKLGVAYIRDDMLWGIVQPAPDKWNWGLYDELVTQLEKRGIELNAILEYTVGWASVGGPRPKLAERFMPQMEPWLAYVRAATQRYLHRIHIWEIWNEPDIGSWQSTTEEYLSLFSHSARTIKETDPQNIVLNGGFGIRRREPNIDFLDEFLPKAPRENWDVFAFHDYRTFGDLLSHREYVGNLCAKYGITLPLWMNEGGISALGQGSEREQAVTLVKKLASAPALGLQSYFVYDLQDDGIDPLNGEHHFGLVRPDFAPKPSFAACQALFRMLGKSNYTRTIRLADLGVWEHLYSPKTLSDDSVAILWNEGALGTTLLWFDQMKNARTFDLMGNPIPHQESQTGTLLTIGDEPIYLKGKHLCNWQPKVVINTPSVLPILPNTENKVTIPFSNPLGKQVHLIIKTSDCSPGIHAFRSQPVDVQSGETKLIPISLVCDAQPATPAVVDLSIAFDNFNAVYRLPVALARQLPLVEKNANEIELGREEGSVNELSDITSIVNLFHAEAIDEMHWHGPEDLSAVSRIAYDRNALYLTVKVSDNVHSQKFSGEHLWKGDSLQLVLQVTPRSPILDMTLALNSSGQPEGWIDSAPGDSPMQRGVLKATNIPHTVYRDDTQTTYALKIPWTALGLLAPQKSGFRLNFLVNDDDGKGRKQWVQLADGIGKGREINKWPWFICRP